jgi:polysaccharide biosynthesis transport protein
MSHDHTDAQYPLLARRPAGGNTSPAPYARGIAALTESSKENLISPGFIFWVLQQWWMVVIPTGLLLAAGAGVAVMLSYTPKYEAAALLMIEDAAPWVAFDRVAGSQSQRYIQTQLELLRSPVVLEPVLSRSEITKLNELSGVEDQVKFLRDGISIKQIGGSELYNIAFTSPSPQAAANVVNAVIDVYMKMHLGDESQRSQRVVDILEEERRRRGLEVERLRKRVVAIERCYRQGSLRRQRYQCKTCAQSNWRIVSEPD